jgi:hypothetical protein
MAIIAQLVGLACLVPFIIVLIKLFQQKGVLHGILGIICGLYTFIWGWINATTLNIKNVMIIWTALIILSIVLNVLFAGHAASQFRPGP